MGILILTLVLSTLLGCITWLAIGNRLPWQSEVKWESQVNITIYTGMLLAPIYLFIFYLF